MAERGPTPTTVDLDSNFQGFAVRPTSQLRPDLVPHPSAVAGFPGPALAAGPEVT